jgi:hypothetical protein
MHFLRQYIYKNKIKLYRKVSQKWYATFLKCTSSHEKDNKIYFNILEQYFSRYEFPKHVKHFLEIIFLIFWKTRSGKCYAHPAVSPNPHTQALPRGPCRSTGPTCQSTKAEDKVDRRRGCHRWLRCGVADPAVLAAWPWELGTSSPSPIAAR